MSTRFIAAIKTTRPGNIILVILGSFLGSFLAYISNNSAQYAQTFINNTSVLLASFSAAIIAAGGYFLNDAHDYKEDNINKPSRPVASGEISKKTAFVIGFLCLLAGVIPSWLVSIYCGIFTITVCLFLVLYTFVFKSIPLLGNIIVSICGGAPLLYGALAVDYINAGYIPFTLAFLLHSSREIIKDAEDVEGDIVAGIRTLATVYSRDAAIRIGSSVMIFTSFIIPLPYFAGWISAWYFLPVVPLVALPMAYYGGGGIIYPGKIESGKVQRVIKWLMLPGMICILLGNIF